jgi:hypothetical protein
MKRLATACIIFSLSGCISADDTEAPTTDTTEQAVSWTSLAWHSCSSLSCRVNLGSSSDRTCFLAGISGMLASGTSSYPAGANIVDNGAWGYNLYILNPNYENIGVMSVCIANTANRVTASWQAGTYATQIAPGPNSTRRCFLSGIYSRNSIGFGSFSSSTLVWADGNYHYLGGSLPAGANDTAFATCVDIANDVGDYAYGNGTGTPFFGNLNYNSAPGGVACGLTGIGGQFTTRSEPGVIVNYDGSSRYWNLSVAPWTGAWASCVL